MPLWHPEVPFVLITSQKAGSTLGTAWFFHHAGLLDEAKAHHAFVHRYEQDIFLSQPGYLNGLSEALAHRPVFKLVREPGERAFSSYLALHAGPESLLADDHRLAIRKQIAKLACMPFTLETRIPFAAFLHWLAESDHRRLDGHEARQVNLYEDELPGGYPEIIKLEEAGSALPQLEARFELPRSSRTELQSFGASGHYATKIESPRQADLIMREGVAVPRPDEVPSITTAFIAKYPDAFRNLKRALGEDFRRFDYPLPAEEDT